MKKIELLTILSNHAKDYHKIACKSIITNHHMNDVDESRDIDQVVVEAIIVDFINYIGAQYCVDYAFNTMDLSDEKRDIK